MGIFKISRKAKTPDRKSLYFPLPNNQSYSICMHCLCFPVKKRHAPVWKASPSALAWFLFHLSFNKNLQNFYNFLFFSASSSHFCLIFLPRGKNKKQGRGERQWKKPITMSKQLNKWVNEWIKSLPQLLIILFFSQTYENNYFYLSIYMP